MEYTNDVWLVTVIHNIAGKLVDEERILEIDGNGFCADRIEESQ